jgi:hypothetical protein
MLSNTGINACGQQRALTGKFEVNDTRFVIGKI